MLWPHGAHVLVRLRLTEVCFEAVCAVSLVVKRVEEGFRSDFLSLRSHRRQIQIQTLFVCLSL